MTKSQDSLVEKRGISDKVASQLERLPNLNVVTLAHSYVVGVFRACQLTRRLSLTVEEVKKRTCFESRIYRVC